MISTEYGKVEGIRKGGCTVYMGIPFAKPPVGELAFRHPVKPESWEGILKADHGSKNPIQSQSKFACGNISEDCLYLNVYVPDHEEGRTLPVMVWVYGGSFSHGGVGGKTEGSDILGYNLEKFAAATNCIIVSFNYRLNLYGFLNLSFLDERFDRNNGLYDQIMALHFVKDNIAAFGGDAEKITVFGQSAGAACILALMSMEETKGLFSQVIVQSACVEHFFTEEESHANTRLYMKKAGVSEPSQLLKLPLEQIMKANDEFESAVLWKAELRCAFSPVIDGITLKQEPKLAAQAAEYPMLIGNTEHEGNLYVQNIPVIVMPILSAILHLKPEKGEEPYWQRVSKAMTDAIFIKPQLEILEGYKGPAWRYQFCHNLEGSKLGTCHISELYFLFDSGKTIDEVEIPESDEAGRIMRKIWGDFARNGNPGWESYRQQKYTENII